MQWMARQFAFHVTLIKSLLTLIISTPMITNLPHFIVKVDGCKDDLLKEYVVDMHKVTETLEWLRTYNYLYHFDLDKECSAKSPNYHEAIVLDIVSVSAPSNDENTSLPQSIHPNSETLLPERTTSSTTMASIH